MKYFKYKVRLFYEFEMQDCGEADRYYAKSEAIRKLEDDVLKGCYTPEEVWKNLLEVLKVSIKTEKLKMEDID